MDEMIVTWKETRENSEKETPSEDEGKQTTRIGYMVVPGIGTGQSKDVCIPMGGPK